MMLDSPSAAMSELAVGRDVPVRSGTATGWIASPAFDLSLLIFAPLVTLPIMAGYVFGNRLLALGGALTLAFAHYLSSAAFYFWDENKDYHRQRWMAFYAGPLILAAVYSLLIIARVPYIVQVALFFWNAVHVARQNCGILSVYRHRAGISDVSQKTAANRAIISTSLFLSLWNIETHVEVSAMFRMIANNVIGLVRFGAGVVAVISIVALARAIWLRTRAGEAPELPETLFLLSSIAFFYPFLLTRSSDTATVAMLLPHYVQYMALVWLVHRRKFGGAPTGAAFLLRKLSSSLVYLIPALAVTGLSFFVIHEVFVRAGHQSVALTIFILIAFEHFYLDGLIWSFKQAHVRRTIAPALLTQARAA